MSTNKVLKARAHLGNESKRIKKSGADPATAMTPALQEARKDLAAAKLEAYISAVVAASPLLSPETAARLAVLLQGGAA